jgi:hypothetical protein
VPTRFRAASAWGVIAPAGRARHAPARIAVQAIGRPGTSQKLR